MSNGIIF